MKHERSILVGPDRPVEEAILTPGQISPHAGNRGPGCREWSLSVLSDTGGKADSLGGGIHWK
jgi:hypothetical protein